MARQINEIQNAIIVTIQEKTGVKLSSSTVAEWKLWAYIFAVAIHVFEVILDKFRAEIDTITNKITPGTVRWYAEMCYRFQNGHELLFDEKTAMLYYAKDDPDSKIVKVVAISENSNKLLIKAATLDGNNKIVPLSMEEKYNFAAYIDAIKFAGVETDVISVSEDKIRYNINVWFDPSIPLSLVRENVLTALDTFKAGIGFDSMIYTQKLIDAVMSAEGVVTCSLVSLSRKGVSDSDFVRFDVYSELESGYFEYDENSILNITSIKELK